LFGAARTLLAGSFLGGGLARPCLLGGGLTRRRLLGGGLARSCLLHRRRWMETLGKGLLACRPVPLLVLLVGDLALNKQLCELSALRFALEGHQAEASKRQARRSTRSLSRRAFRSSRLPS